MNKAQYSISLLQSFNFTYLNKLRAHKTGFMK